MASSCREEAMASSERRSSVPFSPLRPPASSAAAVPGRLILLSDLACNDSPIAGLLPPGTPASSSSTSVGLPCPSPGPFAPAPAEDPPAAMGESLLRSQVQTLLHSVRSESIHGHGAPCIAPPAPSLHQNLPRGFLLSPAALAAPTPLNTPETALPAVALSALPTPSLPSASVCCNLLSASSTAVSCGDGTSNGVAMSPSASPASTHSTPTGTPVVVVDAIAADVFLGKRTLRFDTPQKVDSDMVPVSTSAQKEVDPDEVDLKVSGIGTPCRGAECEGKDEAKEDTSESSGKDGMIKIERAAVLHHHDDDDDDDDDREDEKEVFKIKASKAVLVSKYRNTLPKDDDEEDDADEENCHGEEDYGDNDGEGECGEDMSHTLCSDFEGLNFRGDDGNSGSKVLLPKGEGQHLRFLYEENGDEISEVMVVRGEEEVMEGNFRLRGLPAPCGRHCRFADDGDEEAEENTA